MSTKTKLSQKERVLKYLQDGKKVTQAQLRSWNVLSPSSTISKLRRAGHPIDNEPFQNRQGRTVVRYSLAQ